MSTVTGDVDIALGHCGVSGPISGISCSECEDRLPFRLCNDPLLSDDSIKLGLPAPPDSPLICDVTDSFISSASEMDLISVLSWVLIDSFSWYKEKSCRSDKSVGVLSIV